MQVYTVSMNGVAVTALQDLFSLVVGDDRVVHLLSCTVSQSSDAQDAEEELLRIAIVRGNGTVGSGGSAFTPLQHDSKGAAADTTARINDTTEASAGTEQVMHIETWNVRMPWMYKPTPDEVIRVDQADDIVAIRLLDAPADSLTVSGTLVFREL